MKKLFFALVCLFSLNTLYAQDLKLKTGDEFSITGRNVDKGPVNNYTEYTFQFKVLGKTTEGYKLQCTLLKAKIQQPGYEGSPVGINTDSIHQTKFNYTGLLMPLIILRQPFTAVVSTKGKLIRLEGYSDIAQQAMQMWHLTDYMQDQVNNHFNDFPAGLIRQMFFALPPQHIGYGDNWVDTAGTAFTVTAIRGALFDITANKKAKPYLNGNFVLNNVNGLLESAIVTNADVNLQHSYTQKLSYGKNTAPMPDTAWINMAVDLSFFSTSLKSKSGDSDPAKVYPYLKAHDALYKNDAYYRANILTLVQEINTQQSSLYYDSVLTETPNRFLDGMGSHMHNKMYQVLALNVDSAYDLVRLFYKDDSFTSWLQETYAQDFLPQHTDYDDMKKDFMSRGLTEKQADDIIQQDKNSRINCYLLLDMMRNEKNNLILQQKIEPLYLWITARKEKDNADQLVKTAEQFNHLNDGYMRAGNGGRYGMLIYSLLLDAGKPKVAGEVLNKTVTDLERYAADTLNEDRNADRNLLAHAYYLQYIATAKTDTVKAMKYLVKAAEYSPLKATDKAYSSFYDRLFLNSKESYREDYMDKLFEHGNTDETVKAFADYVNSDLENLDNMQTIYEAHFPGKNFSDFIAGNVVGNWQTAPDFTLKGLDGKEHKLADYKGKWLVMDFWGTWCGPCRMEMPEVNTYNNEINQGKHNGVALLGVACHDNATNVAKFMAENKYGIPQLIGDDLIAKNYNIPGYPTKVIVTPDGKMLLMAFRSDWPGVVDKFSKLYKVN